MPDSQSRRLDSQQNWLLWQSQEDEQETLRGNEYAVFSDTTFTGIVSEGLGPYKFFSTQPWTGRIGHISASLVMRVNFYLEANIPDMRITDETRYHGGTTIADEIAALVSLALGRRVLAGDSVREFDPSADPLGLPQTGGHPRIPFIQSSPLQVPMLPELATPQSLCGLSILESIPAIPHERYVKLVRACRAYQQALWMADVDPNMAWLLLVSSIETAASDETFAQQASEDILRAAKPSLATYLENEGGKRLLLRVADELSHLFQSTKKFIQFGMSFLPEAPERRPTYASSQIDWSANSIKKILGTIYKYRSRFLHDGLPFPAPMLDSHEFVMAPDSLPEHPLVGLGTYMKGGTWNPADLPINLHCFHNLARGLLLNWWRRSLVSLPSKPDDDAVLNG